MDLLCLRVLGGRHRHPDFCLYHVLALPVFTDIGLADFFSFTWAPSEGHYGIMSLLAGSGLVTVGALAMGVPLGVGTAVYLVEIASKRVRRLISPGRRPAGWHPLHHLRLLWHGHHPPVYRAADLAVLALAH